MSKRWEEAGRVWISVGKIGEPPKTTGQVGGCEDQCLGDPYDTRQRVSREWTGWGTRRLYRSLAMFQNPTEAQVATVKELPEVAETSSLVDGMVAIDEHYTRLELSKGAGWKAPPGRPDVTPGYEALMVSEQFTEIAGTQDAASQPKGYHNRLARGGKSSGGTPPH